MRNYTGDFIEYSDGNLSNRKRKRFEKELMSNNMISDNYDLFKQINDHLQGKFDVEEVQNDPNRPNIDLITNQMIFEFQENPNRYQDSRKFVTNSLLDYDIELQHQLDNAKHEAEVVNINKTTGEWVDEWNTKDQIGDLGTESRRAFISSSLSDKNHRSDNGRKSKWNKTYTIRIAGFAAAAMISLLIVIKTVSPPASPEKLYQEYYKPLVTYPSAFRNSNNTDQLLNAIKLYKEGQYKAAAAAFSELPPIDLNTTQVRFYTGITQLELGNFSKAISILNEIVKENGKYKSATQWYLGLAYLRVGETYNAKSYLKELTESNGFYKEVAQGLLNRLK